MEIKYQDKDLVVVYKAANELTQSDNKGNIGVKELLEQELNQEVYMIHRLDYQVSGLLVFALNKKCAAILSEQVSNHETFIKEYYALVYNEFEETSGEWIDLLYKDARKNKAFVVNKKRNGVKEAKLTYKVEKKHNNVNLVHIHLYTGRFHQIRVQFASRKHPLVGDGKYGAKDNEKCIGLCAYHLQFIHPTTKEVISQEIDIWNEAIFKKYMEC